MESLIYFIVAGDYVKIGRTNSVRKRIMALQVGNPLPLKVWFAYKPKGGAIGEELRLHEMCQKYKGRAVGEWFRITDEIEELVEKLKEKYPSKPIQSERQDIFTDINVVDLIGAIHQLA